MNNRNVHIKDLIDVIRPVPDTYAADIWTGFAHIERIGVKMIYIPKQNLHTLNFYTVGYDYPLVIASYSSQEQALIDEANPEIKKDLKALCTWCNQNHLRHQLLKNLQS